MISNNVSKVFDMESDFMYRIGCSCGDPDCDCNIYFEYDKEYNVFDIIFYKKLYIKNSFSLNFFKSVFDKIKLIYKVIFKNYIETESDFMIQDPEHLDSIIEALNEAREKIKNYSDAHKLKK